MDKASITFAEFARVMDCRRSYVTELHKAGRLVLDENGRVLVEESRARIAATRDPAKAAVSARHAAARASRQAEATPAAPAPPARAQAAEIETEAEGEGGTPEPALQDSPETQDYQHWRARNEKAKALAQERENAVAEGKLMDAAEVAGAVSGAITTLRARLESLPDVLGPQLAAIDDEQRCRALLAETIEHTLEETSRAFGAIAREVTPA